MWVVSLSPCSRAALIGVGLITTDTVKRSGHSEEVGAVLLVDRDLGVGHALQVLSTVHVRVVSLQH